MQNFVYGPNRVNYKLLTYSGVTTQTVLVSLAQVWRFLPSPCYNWSEWNFICSGKLNWKFPCSQNKMFNCFLVLYITELLVCCPTMTKVILKHFLKLLWWFHEYMKMDTAGAKCSCWLRIFYGNIFPGFPSIWCLLAAQTQLWTDSLVLALLVAKKTAKCC